MSPVQPLDDVAARRDSVIRTLEILDGVVRPLALEITFGQMDPVTYGVQSETSRRVASTAIPAGVAHQSAYANAAEVELVDALTPAVIRRALTPERAGWDVATIAALVVAARTDASHLELEGRPSLAIPMLTVDGTRWCVGPLDFPGLRLQPPILVTWRQEWGDLTLTVEALWDLWWQMGAAEHTGLRAVERALDAAGFTRPL